MESANLSAVWLTLKLATTVTRLLLVFGTPIAWGRNRGQTTVLC